MRHEDSLPTKKSEFVELTTSYNGPFIVWPAPGMPALVEGQKPHLRLIAAVAADDTGSVLRWAEQLAFRKTFCGCSVQGGSVPVVVESVEPLDRDRIDPKAQGYSRVRGFAELPSTRDLALMEIRVESPVPLCSASPSPVKLYDLSINGSVVRERSVAVFGPRRRRLRLAFVSDLHMASFWDVIGRAAERYDPCLAAEMLHPARLFDRFIDEANALWSRGELDLVVLGGDLVEFVHDRPPTAAGAFLGETNVHTVARALRRLCVPSIAIPGTHDYRAFPWRPRLYGLASIGISAARGRSLLKRAGLWDRWPLRPSDLAALRTEDEAGNSALAHHLKHLAPATDFEETLHGTRLVFASTGRDLVSRWRSVGWARRGLLMRSLRHCWRHPDSEGLSRRRVEQIASSLSSSQGAVVFFHSPLLNSSHGIPVEQCLDRLDPGDVGWERYGDDLGAQLAFERRIRRGGMRRGVFFHNPGLLIRALISAGGPVATFSGHGHKAQAIEFDRRTLAVRSVPFGPPHAPERTVTMLTAPALGQFPRSGARQPAGYLLATFEDGRLVSMKPRTVG